VLVMGSLTILAKRVNEHCRR